jgi:EAL domain-containing protein (putative c-di-GMP-specific phosphodiesterase class I)
MNVSTHLSPTPLASLDGIESCTTREGRCVTGSYKNLQLTSQFQPIFSLAHHRAVGCEALLRAYTLEDEPLSPLAVFATSSSEHDGVFLDRLCRNIHVRNFQLQNPGNSWLFLNVSPHIVTRGRHYGPYFSGLLRRYGVRPSQIVIEILEDRIADEAMLAETVAYYRELGCLVAIDDFGAGHSNFDRIWRIAPNIVKLDRSIIVQAASQPRVRRVIPNLVNLIHESGSLALMEGIETETEALIAMDAGIDFVQGYYFGRPTIDLHSSRVAGAETLANLCLSFSEFSKADACRHHSTLQPYLLAFESMWKALAAGVSPSVAIQEFSALPRFERCFLLDGEGKQLGRNFTAPSLPTAHDPRFEPLADAQGAVWSRRHYFRRAMSKPGEVQISRPYLSITGLNMSVTLSILLQINGDAQVVCVDLDWTDN